MALYKNDLLTGKLNLLAGTSAIDKVFNENSNNPIENKVITIKIKEIEQNFEGIKQTVQKGKEKIANSITNKGIETNSSDTFDTMSQNINKITGSIKNYGIRINTSLYVNPLGYVTSIYGILPIESEEIS